MIDSDVVAAYLKGRPDAVSLLQRLLPDGLAISAISYGEIVEGIYYGTDPKRHQQTFQAFLRGVRVLPVDKRVAARFAELRGQLRKQGQLIPDADLLIAATAVRHNLVLVTRNCRHFERAPGLKLHQEAGAVPQSGQS